MSAQSLALPRVLDAHALGSVLVVAPHPDDESMGCGGLMALLRTRRIPVFVLLLSDGEMSHPGSRAWSPAARAALRRLEFTQALAALNLEPQAMLALGLPDGALPGCEEPGFAAAVTAVERCMRSHPHQTLLVPWRRDPHADHRAGSAIARAANAGLTHPMRVLEYGVWMAERGSADDLPCDGEAIHWQLDIRAVVERKLAALAAHRSQCGDAIFDDPLGFTLPLAMRMRCADPREVFFEVTAAALAPSQALRS